MCDICADLLELLDSHDARFCEKDGMQLSKLEVLAVALYAQLWPQKQCMCCYKDVKNFERLNNLVQLVMHRAIGFIETLPKDSAPIPGLNTGPVPPLNVTLGEDQTTDKSRRRLPSCADDTDRDIDVTGLDVTDESSVSALLSELHQHIQREAYDDASRAAIDGQLSPKVHECKASENGDSLSLTSMATLDSAQMAGLVDSILASKTQCDSGANNVARAILKNTVEPDESKHLHITANNSDSSSDITKLMTVINADGTVTEGVDMQGCFNEVRGGGFIEDVREGETWTLDEKDRLFQFVSKVFQLNFPFYLAFKHCVHSSLEELSKQDTCALNNYCELNDPDVPVSLLRNVCYFCDTNGVQALANCFRDSDPETLPCHVAHTLITICANLRMWMNFRTAMRYVADLRSHVIRYMCCFTERDLRTASTRNMTDLMWAALKEPREAVVSFDKEGLDLAFKYFTCTMLTLRLAGIAQINNQIVLYTELSQSGSPVLVEAASIGFQLADWLVENKIIDHIFGPNLHVEIIKQSQSILNFLAVEGRLTNEHIDVIWLAGQAAGLALQRIFEKTQHSERLPLRLPPIKRGLSEIRCEARLAGRNEMTCRPCFSPESKRILSMKALKLKHCGKQVYDILVMIIKNLELAPARHLLSLMSQLDPASHTEQTLLLSSAIIRQQWISAVVQRQRAVTASACLHGNQQQQYYLQTVGHIVEDDVEITGSHAPDLSSSGRSENSEATSGSGLEEGEVKSHLVITNRGGRGYSTAPPVIASMRGTRRGIKHWTGSQRFRLRPGNPRRARSSSTEGQRSDEGGSDDNDDDEEEDEESSEGASPPREIRGVGKRRRIGAHPRVPVSVECVERALAQVRRRATAGPRNHLLVRIVQQCQKRRAPPRYPPDAASEEPQSKQREKSHSPVQPEQQASVLHTNSIRPQTSRKKPTVQKGGNKIVRGAGRWFRGRFLRKRGVVGSRIISEVGRRGGAGRGRWSYQHGRRITWPQHNVRNEEEEEDEDFSDSEKVSRRMKVVQDSQHCNTDDEDDDEDEEDEDDDDESEEDEEEDEGEEEEESSEPNSAESEEENMHALRSAAKQDVRRGGRGFVRGSTAVSHGRSKVEYFRKAGFMSGLKVLTNNVSGTSTPTKDRVGGAIANAIPCNQREPVGETSGELELNSSREDGTAGHYADDDLDVNRDAMNTSEEAAIMRELEGTSTDDDEDDEEEEDRGEEDDDDGHAAAEQILLPSRICLKTGVREYARNPQLGSNCAGSPSPGGGRVALFPSNQKSMSQEELESYLAQMAANTPGTGGAHLMNRYITDDILSAEDGSCNSSHFTNKSEKNMSDFEGDEGLSDPELQHINQHAFMGNLHTMQQLQPYIDCMSAQHFRRQGMSKGPRGLLKSSDAGILKIDEICKPGNTLVWDMVQDHNIDKLPEGLVHEAEKILGNLICFNCDKMMRTKFIEACIENLVNHKSVYVSLRLLSKIFSSFQQPRSSHDQHSITMWAERELKMMTHFFNDLMHYTNLMKQGWKPPHSLYSYKEEIQARLSFLTSLFSSNGSPDNFHLSLEQVDALWNCLALDPQCSDDCLSWFLTQTKSKDQHSLSPDAFAHIFHSKLPQLRPEDVSTVGLLLFTHLCQMAHQASLDHDQDYGIDQLWGIALRAQNTDVSLTAINHLNHHYIGSGGALDGEEEFVQKCMRSLTEASSQLDQHPDSSLQIIQRGLILLTNHLEGFRKRYAYHLRQWQFDSSWMTSHQKSHHDKHCQTIHVVLQPPSAEKTTIEMQSSDLIAELRAEVARWWEFIQRRQQRDHDDSSRQAGTSIGCTGTSVLTPILGAMLGDGPMRMISQGQELGTDFDEKTLADMQFKDMQIVFVSQSVNRPTPRKTDGSTAPSCLPPPPRNKLPMLLLIKEPHFTCLFSLLQQLSNFCPRNIAADCQEQRCLQIRARLLSRKVWDLLMLLPTNSQIQDGFRKIVNQPSVILTHKDKGDGDSSGEMITWEELLDPLSPQKLMYSLQIVETLLRPPKYRRRSYLLRTNSGAQMTCLEATDKSADDQPEEIWSRKFINCGGLRHLFNIFLSGRLQRKDGDYWNEWLQDCLAYLLRLVSQFAAIQLDTDQAAGSSGASLDGGTSLVAGSVVDDIFDIQESPVKKTRKQKQQQERLIVIRLNQTIMSMMDVDAVVTMLMNIINEVALPRREFNQWPSSFSGHIQVIHYAMSLLVSIAYTCGDTAQPAICNSQNFSDWLNRLTLTSPELSVRQESCQGLYRLCLGRTVDGQTGYRYLIPVLASLLTGLDDAQAMKAVKKVAPQEEKESHGPGCRDYFWLVCHLVDHITKEDAANSWEQEGNALDLNILMAHVARSIVTRSYVEKRHQTTEDDALIGFLNLSISILKHDPPFKFSNSGQTFLHEIFQCLFALPNPKQRYLPKCKSQNARSAAFDVLVELVRGSVENYALLHAQVMRQHHKDSHLPYSWDNWPHDEERARCGYVGLTNLGATCYMATSVQHLYMIPEARKCILEAKFSLDTHHEDTLIELKRMFAYLMESERKAYNPRSFCKVYTMDHQPLNTGEQKDMTEFFTDLITKLEEMGPELKRLVKGLFGGVLTNNVVSLDCPHVSRTKEEFYTIRCQVADMKNLYESLDEVTVKDQLEGDNMYTCSKCQRKVRAEKRACFKRLPTILCFNTMRYTFNMVTMTKEKVNTHFSFPFRLDMSPYMEKNLIRKERLQDDGEVSEDDSEATKGVSKDPEGYEYDLIGVTVHTGTADGGHYYSFIKERTSKTSDVNNQDKWLLFNDAEVKQFDGAQLPSECFGGEMTSKTYDSVTDKFMDFSFEKTNSAYMLFYECMGVDRSPGLHEAAQQECSTETSTTMMMTSMGAVPQPTVSCSRPQEPSDDDDQQRVKIELAPDLAEWIWQDNMQFLQDKNIFEHTYFTFMWQICSSIPPTLPRTNPEYNVSLIATQLSASFILETLLHAKEKPTLLQWIELATKLFNADKRCCEWFLDTMAEDDWWPQQLLIKCPNLTVRQMFQRLVIHVINQLKPLQTKFYQNAMSDDSEEEDDEEEDEDEIEVNSLQGSSKTCVARFIKRMLAILEHDAHPQCKYLSEYFGLLLEFARMGESECRFLLQMDAVSIMVNFFMSHKQQENYIDLSDEDKDVDDVINLTDDKYCPVALEKMITLVTTLVEKSRGVDRQLHLSERDTSALIGGKGYPFLFHQIKDAINLRATCSLIFCITRWNDRLAVSIIQMIFGSIHRLGLESGAFFKLLGLLVECNGSMTGLPAFMQYIVQKLWEVIKICPQACLDWLSTQVTRNKYAHSCVLENLEIWVEPHLLATNNGRVRNATAYLLINLVPSHTFRSNFRSNRSILSPHKEPVIMSEEATEVLHQIYRHLLKLLAHARFYVDAQTHGTAKLVPYFSVLNYCLISRTEKQMFSAYFNDLWQLFQPKLSEPPIAIHQNKQAMLIFWHQACLDCPENVRLIVSNPNVTKNIAFNYILADHDDQEVILINRTMLPAYYSILRMCCQFSRTFTRQLAQHQNIQWAFKNISPHPTHYTAAVEELFRLMQLMVVAYPDSSEEDLRAIMLFRRNTIQLFLQILDGRTQWQTLLAAMRILVEGNDERLLVIQNGGLPLLHDSFNTLFMMHHEATACHVMQEFTALLKLVSQILETARKYIDDRKSAASNQNMSFNQSLTNQSAGNNVAEVKPHLNSWKERGEFAKKLLTLLNSYTHPDLRSAALEAVREMVLTFQTECIQVIVPVLVIAHTTFQESTAPNPVPLGPYYPRLAQKCVTAHKSGIRCQRPQFQMFLNGHMMEATFGVDAAYDHAMLDYFEPYHAFVDLLVRVSVNHQTVTDPIIRLSALVAVEGVPLRLQLFAKLWYEIYISEMIDRKCVTSLCNTNHLIDYMDGILAEERTSLNISHIYQFFCTYFPKVYQHMLNDQGHSSLMESILNSIEINRPTGDNPPSSTKEREKMWNTISGDLRALQLIFSVQPRKQLPPTLVEGLNHYLQLGRAAQQLQRGEQQEKDAPSVSAATAAKVTEDASTNVATAQTHRLPIEQSQVHDDQQLTEESKDEDENLIDAKKGSGLADQNQAPETTVSHGAQLAVAAILAEAAAQAAQAKPAAIVKATTGTVGTTRMVITPQATNVSDKTESSAGRLNSDISSRSNDIDMKSADETKKGNVRKGSDRQEQKEMDAGDETLLLTMESEEPTSFTPAIVPEDSCDESAVPAKRRRTSATGDAEEEPALPINHTKSRVNRVVTGVKRRLSSLTDTIQDDAKQDSGSSAPCETQAPSSITPTAAPSETPTLNAAQNSSASGSGSSEDEGGKKVDGGKRTQNIFASGISKVTAAKEKQTVVDQVVKSIESILRLGLRSNN